MASGSFPRLRKFRQNAARHIAAVLFFWGKNGGVLFSERAGAMAACRGKGGLSEIFLIFYFRFCDLKRLYKCEGNYESQKRKELMNMIVTNPLCITEQELKAMARDARGGIRNLYLHWTAGHYGQDYDDYHLCIDRDGTVYVNCRHLLEYKPHTWMRNHSAIGIALCCGVDAE